MRHVRLKPVVCNTGDHDSGTTCDSLCASHSELKGDEMKCLPIIETKSLVRSWLLQAGTYGAYLAITSQGSPEYCPDYHSAAAKTFTQGGPLLPIYVGEATPIVFV